MKEELKGVAVHDIELKKKGDLYFFEFPILSHFQDQYGANYLFQPVEKDEKHSRWLVIKVTDEGLEAHFNKEKSLLDLIWDNPDGYALFVDAGFWGKHEHVTRVANADIPADYLPLNTSYFDEKVYEDYWMELRDSLQAKKSQALQRIAEVDIEEFVQKQEKGNLLNASKVVFHAQAVEPFALLAAYKMLKGQDLTAYKEVVDKVARIDILLQQLDDRFVELEERLQAMSHSGTFPEFDDASFQFSLVQASSLKLKSKKKQTPDELEFANWLRKHLTPEQKQQIEKPVASFKQIGHPAA